jgi:glycosyltransferase involved in cell wall biosynthesis
MSQPKIPESWMASSEISVVIPTYNRDSLILRAVTSALANVRPGDEVLVVDDGSTDNTAEILAPLAGRLRYLRLPHAGAGATRNHGVRLARKPLVAFLDSDDEWMPGKLTLQRALMDRRPDVLFCCSDFSSREPTGDKPRHLHTWHQDPRPWDEILGPGVPYSDIAPLPSGQADFRVHFGDLYLAEMERDYVATFTLVIRRERAGEALRFAEDVVTFEDWECIARLARAGTAAFMDCDTAYQWGHAGPRLTDAKTWGRATSRLTILERVWGADEPFLALHAERFAQVCAGHHIQRAACLLRQGLPKQARNELRKGGGSPLLYWFLASLPGPVVRGLLGLCRFLRAG